MQTTSSSTPAGLVDFATSIARSDLFIRYRGAFRQATGRVLRLIDAQGCASQKSSCPVAQLHHVPVSMNGRQIAFLAVDPYRLEGDVSSFDAYAHSMLDQGATPGQLRLARRDFDQLPALCPAASGALETMLEIFAEHLGAFSEKLFLQTHENEPQAVLRARKYIGENLSQPISLESVSARAGMSECYFCKVFKKATGFTLTEFVTRARIEKAKRLLLRPQARVTEVAYDVGFQSLSQFNRSFRKITGQSPTQFRDALNMAAKAA